MFRTRRRWRLPVLGAILLLGAGLGMAVAMGAIDSGRPGQHVPAVARRAPVDRAAHVAPPAPARPSGAPVTAQQLTAIDATLRYTPFISIGGNRRRVIALTFDDGPSPYTPPIVRLLARMRVAATFFVVGQQLDFFSAGLRDELRTGLAIGDHTENHAWLIRLKRPAQFGQVRDAAARISQLGAAFPRLFRPPYGSFDRATLAVLRQLRMLMVLWSIDPSDWRRPGVGPIVSNVLSHARPGAIVLLHDGGGDRSQTLAALPQIINGLRGRHYQLVTVPQLIQLDPPGRNQKPPVAGGL
ncbi:MAG: polysaccharide deacetylase family protein [Solirubrobacterales bacterium]|nr:polysaccharide deacetylase family protein [Solirubrobacterales bacterium]